jgi:N utilization substance protein B
MKSRHRSREIALQILYQYDLNSAAKSQATPSPKELIEHLKYHYDHFAVPEPLREFIGQIVAGTLNHLTEIDSLLEKQAAHWKVARMGSVDRSLLRMAAYEMLYLKETPTSVVIDEAVELAKQFGTSDTPAFINGILDGIKVPTI